MPQRATLTPQKTRVDWGVAKARYVALGSEHRSYLRISREFKVSEVTVRKWAKRHGWVEAAAAADAKSAAKELAKAQRTIEERNSRTVELTEALRDRALAKLGEVDVNVAVRSLPRYVALEQLIAGEATSRPDLGEVQTMFNAIFVVAGKWVGSDLPPAERRAGFLAELDGAVGGLAVIEGGKAAA